MNKIRLAFRIHLSSDYHSGSGHRAGPVVDSALLRDFDGTPVLRGSKIAGLLRDGLKDLLDLLDSTPLQIWKARIENEKTEIRLFGAAHAQKIWRYSSGRPIDVIGNRNDPRWGSVDVTRVRIEPHLRRADSQKLFIQEEGDRRLVFEFTAACDAPDEQDQKDALLLAAAASLVRHLGSARRRGRGACSIELIKAEGLEWNLNEKPHQSALLLFKKFWLESTATSPPLAEVQSNAEATEQKAAARDEAKTAVSENNLASNENKPLRFQCVALLEEPLILSRRGEAGNAYESIPAISGGAILGALATRAARTLKLKPFDVSPYQPAPLNFANLFVRGEMAVTGLFPVNAEIGQSSFYAALPAPHDILICEKHKKFMPEELLPHDFQMLTLNGKTLPEECGYNDEGNICKGKLEGLAKPFLAMTPKGLAFEPNRREEAHIRMVRETGRVEDGVLFEYITLEAGQYFLGEITFANAVCWQRFKAWTGVDEEQIFELYLGRASRRGHGKLSLHLRQMDDVEPPSWIQYKLDERLEKAKVLNEGFRMTLLTDTIVQDAWSRVYLSFEKEWLAGLFGLAPEHIELCGSFAQTCEVDSFNGQRRLPRWRDTALKAGSAVGIKITKDGWLKLDRNAQDEKKKLQTENAEPSPPSDSTDEAEMINRAYDFWVWKLREIEQNGIGLRRHEGFGRVAFNHPIYWKTRAHKPIRIPNALVRNPAPHHLANEKGFVAKWSGDLDKLIEDDLAAWQKIDKWFAPLAFVIFSSRFLSHSEIKKRMEMFKTPTPAFLWNKQVTGREKKDRIEPKAYGCIEKVLETLARSVPDQERDKRWSKGLAILAERIALQVKAATEKEVTG